MIRLVFDYNCRTNTTGTLDRLSECPYNRTLATNAALIFYAVRVELVNSMGLTRDHVYRVLPLRLDAAKSLYSKIIAR